MQPLLALMAMTAISPAQQDQAPRVIHSTESKLAIKVRLDGEYVQTQGTAPIMAGSRVLVPMRGIFERLGAHLSWDATKREVTVTSQQHQILLPIGKMTATMDGDAMSLDQPAMIVDNFTFVPLRFVGEALGAKVDWLTAERTVDIVTQSAN